MRHKREAAEAENNPKAPESGTQLTEPEGSESGTSATAPSASIEGAPLKWTEHDLDAALIEYRVHALGLYGYGEHGARARAGAVLRHIHENLFQQRLGENGQTKYKSWPQFVAAEVPYCKNAKVADELMSRAPKAAEPAPMDRRSGYPKLSAHPAADAFPMMSEKELEELAADIKANGLREAIIVHEGAILDGRNRYVACQIAGTSPRFAPWSSLNLDVEDDDDEDEGAGDPVAFVVSKNLKRRHMDETQRAMVAARLAKMKQGARTDIANIPPIGGMSQAEAAKTMNVSERSVERASAVLKKGDPEIVDAVERGEVSLGDASNVIPLPPTEQRDALKKVRSGEASTLTKATKEKPRSAPEAAKDAKPTATKAKTYRVLASGRRDDANKPDTAYAVIEVEGKRIEVEIDFGNRPDKWRAFESVGGEP
jgi:ParB-like chromosome segregation protein Spo0J